MTCEVSIEEGVETNVLFAYSYDEKRAAPRASAISGSVEGGEGCTVRLRAEEPGGGPSERLAEVDEGGGYVFSGLPAGRYFVDVKQRRLLNRPRPLVLDGRNQPRCDLVTQVEPSGEFRFDSLPAGDYDLYAEGFGSQGIHLDAGDRLSIQLWQSEEGWRRQTRIQPAAATPGMIMVRWAGRPDLTIIVTDADGGMEELDASEAGEADPSCHAEFGPFPPGAYLVHCPELAISAEVELAAGEAVVVSF